MKTKTPNIVLLGLPKGTSIPKLIVRVTTIANAMAADKTMFPSPTPALAQVLSDTTALTSAETAFKAHTGTRTARDDARDVVVVDAHGLHTYVQSLVNANPAQAEAIATAAAMTLKKAGLAHKNALEVKQTISGTVHVIARATKGAKANHWQYTTDGGKTWIDAPPTTKASTTIASLTPGITVQVRHRVLTKTGLGDWSEDVTHVVA